MMNKLDGADILYMSDQDDFGFVYYTDLSISPIRISYLAICQYESDFSYYLFLLNEKMEVEQDDECDTVQQAMELGRRRNSNVKWKEFKSHSIENE